MKKYGKYEMRPEGVPVKQSKVKSALLQTYLTSLLCMVLCVTMFFGTSYAWFTSEVTNEGNEIYIGTLDVDLQDENGKSFAGSEKKLFAGNIRWEPGYTALETIKVVNEGDLAFKYELNFTDGALADDSNAILADVAKFFDVWVYDYRENNGQAPTPGNYSDISTENGWVPAGSLDELLAGKAVLDGVMETVRQDDKTDDPTTPNQTDDGVATEDTYTIALHMKEETDDASVMGQKITLNVKLVAYQMASEEDGFGGNYDKVTAVTSAEDFVNALTSTEGGTVLLLNDIEIPADSSRIDITGKVNLDLNGKTLTLHRSGTSIMVRSTGSLIISGNGTIEKTSHIGNMLYADGELTIMDGTYKFSSYNWGRSQEGIPGDCGTEKKVVNGDTGEVVSGDCHCSVSQDSTTGKYSVSHHCSNAQNLGSLICGRLNDSDEYNGKVTIYSGYFDTGILNPSRVDAESSPKVHNCMYPMFNGAANREKDLFTIYGGTFVTANPKDGDDNARKEDGKDDNTNVSTHIFFLYGQTEPGVVPAGYTVVQGTTEDGRTTYTYSYTDPESTTENG